MSRDIIFHHPCPIEGGASASRVRPFRMLNAFVEAGYQVETVVGSTQERAEAIQKIKGQVQRGREFSFVYSESSTLPTALTADRYYRNRPFLDFSFFGWAKRQGMPIGLFYRDVHWKFDHYRRTRLAKRAIALPLYWYDWFQYRRTVDILFVPTLAMRDVLPTKWPLDRLKALPPGCHVSETTSTIAKDIDGDQLDLFYVGGITPPNYDLRPLISAIQAVEGISLTICCRPKDWQAARSLYSLGNGNKVRIVHAQGADLQEYYASADLFAVIWQPYPYWSHTIPFKVFEPMGFGLPIVATEEAIPAASEIVAKVGWVTPTIAQVPELLEHLRANPLSISEKREQIKAVRADHTWLARARSVGEILTRPA